MSDLRAAVYTALLNDHIELVAATLDAIGLSSLDAMKLGYQTMFDRAAEDAAAGGPATPGLPSLPLGTDHPLADGTTAPYADLALIARALIAISDRAGHTWLSTMPEAQLVVDAIRLIRAKQYLDLPDLPSRPIGG